MGVVSPCFRSSASDGTSILATCLLIDFTSRNRAKPDEGDDEESHQAGTDLT